MKSSVTITLGSAGSICALITAQLERLQQLDHIELQKQITRLEERATAFAKADMIRCKVFEPPP